MFDLAAFDSEVTQRKLADQKARPYRAFLQDVLSPREDIQVAPKPGAYQFAETGAVVAASIGAAVFVLGFIGPLPALGEDEMTYNGMTLSQFAVQMQLPADDPYLIALFEELCMTT